MDNIASARWEEDWGGWKDRASGLQEVVIGGGGGMQRIIAGGASARARAYATLFNNIYRFRLGAKWK